jgi:hypothetical protein
MIQGYINAKALGWDSEVWRFSLKTNDKKLAQKRLKKLFNVMKSDLTSNYKLELEKIIYNGQAKPVKKRTKKPAIIKDSLDYIMEQYVNNFEIQDCLECDKTRRPFHIGYEQRFCHECEHFKDKNQWSVQKSRHNTLKPFFGDVRIKDFNFDMVKDYILKMKNTKSKKTNRTLTDDSIINYLDFLKSCLNLYYDENDTPMPFNVRKFLRYKKHLSGRYKLKKQERPDDFTRKKLDLLLQWLTDKQTKLILETMYFIPSRIGEYTRKKDTMKKSQFEYPYLTVIPEKDGDTRKVKLPDELADKYQEMINNSETDYIFNTSYRAVYGQFVRACKTLNLDLTIHQLKIRAATRAFSRGLNTKQVQKLGGWKSIAMPLRYQKLATNEMDEISETIFN